MGIKFCGSVINDLRQGVKKQQNMIWQNRVLGERRKDGISPVPTELFNTGRAVPQKAISKC
jgi:hypothetical protein